MGILIGMDEAGYGPNFGPLVVAATAWEVSGERGAGSGERDNRGFRIADCGLTRQSNGRQSAIRNPKSEIESPLDLYRLLRTVVGKRANNRRIAIADSKSLYTPGLGLHQLERGLHTVLLSMRQTLTRWSEIVQYCGADPDNHHQRTCWPDEFNCSLPVDAAIDELSRLEPRFTQACDAAGVRPLLIRARLIYPAQFNDLVEYHGTKGAALSHITVALLREVMNLVTNRNLPQPPVPSPQPPIFAVCDKHGGRNFYAALLQHHFSEHWIEPVLESHTESHYEWGNPESRVRVTFRMQGERFLPTALASMTAKYLRELAMRAFNEFWCACVEGLRPTAGYPKDARRFRNDIATAQKELKIDDHVLWRIR